MTDPTPDQIRAARLSVGLTQAQAAKLIHASSYRTWQEWESGRRKMPQAKWEMWKMLTKCSVENEHFLI